MRIWLQPQKLAAFSLTPADVETALRTQNVELPAGRLESAAQNVTLRVERPFASAAEFGNLVVRRGEGGYLVRLSDVARVEQGPENPIPRSASTARPRSGWGCPPVRRHTLEVANAVKTAATEMTPICQKALPYRRIRRFAVLNEAIKKVRDAGRGGGAGGAGHLPVSR